MSGETQPEITGEDLILRMRERLFVSDTDAAALTPALSDFDLNPHLERPAPKAQKPAAVLIPVILRADGPSVLLTRRAEHLPSHAGQISFPGGRAQSEDTSLIDTALRETEEEVGLDRAFITVVGTLEPYRTVTDFSVLPVVALVREGFVLTTDPGEVAEAFEVPATFLLDPANQERHSAEWQGQTRRYFAIPYRDYYIWGATAAMLVAFTAALYGTGHDPAEAI